ncbi:MAG: thymidylate synthase, partial [Pseudomonadota bacterium]|nr:thymidylate synthase [Pseudomonadota bacterium]
MHQYLELCRRIVDEGVWIENERTGKRCLTVINADLSYDVGGNKFPIITTRKSYWKAAIAELLGYLRGYGSAAEFRKLG